MIDISANTYNFHLNDKDKSYVRDSEKLTAPRDVIVAALGDVL